MIENRKAIAPIPAVGAAGEQSHGSKTRNIITEKSRTNNLNTGNLKTLSMTELYDTTYPPKAAIIDGLLLLHGAAQLSCRDGNFLVAIRRASGRSAVSRP